MKPVFKVIALLFSVVTLLYFNNHLKKNDFNIKTDDTKNSSLKSHVNKNKIQTKRPNLKVNPKIRTYNFPGNFENFQTVTNR